MAGPVVILTGPPGAGKSTVADVLARQSEMPAVHLHSDDFYDRYILSGYVLPWLPESRKQNEVVTGVIAGAACAYAAGGYFTLIDGIVGPWFLTPYRQAAAAKNIPLHYIVLRPANADICFARVQQRGTHGLKAEGPVRELFRQFANLGELEPHAVANSGDDPSETARAISDALQRGDYRLV
jgi:gluconate kinase